MSEAIESRIERKTFYSYGGYYRATCDFIAPRSLPELRATLAMARQAKRTLSFSGAGLSFDNQYLSDDLIVSLRHLDSIRVLPAERAVEVGPGARWGNILKATYAHNLLPYVMITGSQPTAGGTLSAHTNSIFTPCCGKEGKHVIELDLMLADGSTITCSREQNSAIFYGAIAGLGSLGAFTRIKYRLLDLKRPSGLHVEAIDYDDIEDLERRFRVRPGEGIDDVENVWSESSLFFIEDGRPKFTLYRRKFVPLDRAGSHFSPYLYLSIVASAFVRFSPFYANRFLAQDRKRRPEDKRLLKGMQGIYYGTFFVEPDFLLSRLLGLVGYRAKLYQNSYFIPLQGDNVTRFTRRTVELMQERGLSFSMFDILYVPRDEPFLLSASRDVDGFYINTTFLDAAGEEGVMAYYAALNELCVEMGGKINLVKNAFIEPEVLTKMFEGPLEELTAIKRRVDPERMFNSLFLRQKFPRYFAA